MHSEIRMKPIWFNNCKPREVPSKFLSAYADASRKTFHLHSSEYPDETCRISWLEIQINIIDIFVCNCRWTQKNIRTSFIRKFGWNRYDSMIVNPERYHKNFHSHVRMKTERLPHSIYLKIRKKLIWFHDCKFRSMPSKFLSAYADENGKIFPSRYICFLKLAICKVAQ